MFSRAARILLCGLAPAALLAWSIACDQAASQNDSSPAEVPAGDDGGVVRGANDARASDVQDQAPEAGDSDAVAFDARAIEAASPSPVASADSAPPTADDLLAYDDMGSMTGDISSFGTPDSSNDYSLAPGFGWCTGCGWSLYGETAQAGQASIESSALLGYLNLQTSGYRLLHTRDVQGRMLDVKGAFADYAVSVGNNAVIGKEGTTLWMSALVRIEASLGSDPVVLTTHSDPSAWHDGEATWSVGLFMSDEWSLFSAGDPSVGNRASTGKSYAAGATAFLVVRFEFSKSATEIALYVDPLLTPNAPASADAVITTASPLSFRDFALGANGPPVSLDELRFGRTFASVTPMQ